MKKKILWIEDGANMEVASYTGPVDVDPEYALDIALDVTDGIKLIRQHEYDAIVVDIRLPPGDDGTWQKVYDNHDDNKVLAKLGLELLKTLLRPDLAEIQITNIPDWIKPEIFGVLSVESYRENEELVKQLKIPVYENKSVEADETLLLNVIKKIIK